MPRSPQKYKIQNLAPTEVPSTEKKERLRDNTWSVMKSIAATFGYYYDPNSKIENCANFGGISNIPAFLTQSVQRLKRHSNIIIVILDTKKNKRINDNHLRLLEEELYEMVNEHKNDSNNKFKLFSRSNYEIVCLCLTRNYPTNYTIVNDDCFKAMTILGNEELSNIFYSQSPPSNNFSRLSVKSWELKDINPYSNQNAYDSSNAIFVPRELSYKIKNSDNNMAIYGGRRIGKSSICKEIQKKTNKFNSKCIYISASSYAFEKNENVFRKGLQIAEVILSTLSREFSDHANEFIKLKNFADFNYQINTLYNNYYQGKKITIIIDEFDRYIEQSDLECQFNEEDNEYKLVDSIRHIHTEEENIRFILAGFTVLWSHLVGTGSSTLTTKGKNPFKGLADYEAVNDMSRKKAKQLVNTLNTDLALEFENDDLVNYILDKTGHHPAFIQGFCSRLVDSISDRITSSYRRIRLKDIDEIFIPKELDDNGKLTYFGEVNDIIAMNFDIVLDNRSYKYVTKALMIFVSILESGSADENQYITKTQLLENINNFLENYGQKLTFKTFEATVNTLKINQVIVEGDQIDDIRFRYSFWHSYVEYLDRDPDFLEDVMKDAANEIMSCNGQ